MKNPFYFVLIIIGILGGVARAEPQNTDELSKMFTWWNAAFLTQGAYTPDAFRKYFTEDAVLIIDGAVSTKGVDGWAQHFQRIQSGDGNVEIVLPFRKVAKVGNTIYTYHIIRNIKSGVRGCLLAAGYATVVDNKISEVVLVRSPIDINSDSDCLKK